METMTKTEMKTGTRMKVTYKIRYKITAVILSVALLFSSAQTNLVFASSNDSEDKWIDEFEGWSDNAIEDTYVTYQVTDWASMKDKLITKSNSVGGSVKAVKLSARIKAMKKSIQKEVEKTISDKNSVNNYTQIMLAMAQAFADKSADNDPYMWQTYIDPTYSDTGIMTQEKSIALAFARLTKMESLYAARYGTSAMITSKDSRYNSVLAGYIAGEGYIDKNNKYTKQNVQDYITDNPDQYIVTKADGTAIAISPLCNYPDLVNSYLNIMYVGGNGANGYGKGGMNIPIIYQGDYANVKWGNDNIKNAGCGVASLAMVLTYLTGRNVTVNELANKYNSSAYRLDGGATKGSSLYPKAASDYGVKYICHTSNIETVRKNLAQGNPVICSQKSGLFTKNRHFIVLRGIEDASQIEDVKVWVNDPNGRRSGSRAGYTPSGWLNKSFNLVKDVHRTLNSGYYIFSK